MKFDRTLVKIRERSFPDLLDLAVVVTRKRFNLIAPAAIVGIVPFLVLNAWVVSLENLDGLLIFLIPLEAPWATAPLTVVLARLMFGEKISFGRTAKRLFVSLPSLIFFQLILRAILLVMIVTSPLIPTRLGFINEVLLLERQSVFKSFRRAGTLRDRRGGDLLGQFLAYVIASAAFIVCCYVGSGTILNSIFDSNLTWEEPDFADLTGLRVQIPLWIAIGFGAIVRFFSYIDQRIRLEGWEVELRLKLAGQAMEEARGW